MAKIQNWLRSTKISPERALVWSRCEQAPPASRCCADGGTLAKFVWPNFKNGFVFAEFPEAGPRLIATLSHAARHHLAWHRFQDADIRRGLLRRPRQMSPLPNSPPLLPRSGGDPLEHNMNDLRRHADSEAETTVRRPAPASFPNSRNGLAARALPRPRGR